MYDETNVPPPDYRVRPVVRFLLTRFCHPFTNRDGSVGMSGSSSVLGTFDNEDQANEVAAMLEQRERLIQASQVSEDGMVPAEPEDMNAALVQISAELGCQCTLDDILHSIDRLRTIPPLPQTPPQPTVLVRDGVPVHPSNS